jgi:hypothetical protein
MSAMVNAHSYLVGTEIGVILEPCSALGALQLSRALEAAHQSVASDDNQQKDVDER